MTERDYLIETLLWALAAIGVLLVTLTIGAIA